MYWVFRTVYPPLRFSFHILFRNCYFCFWVQSQLFFSRFDGVVVRWFAPVGYILSCILILLTYISPVVRGATRWISIAGVQILQPSELCKPLFLLAFAWLMEKYPPRQLRYFPIHFIFSLFPFFSYLHSRILGRVSCIFHVVFYDDRRRVISFYCRFFGLVLFFYFQSDFLG